MMLSNPILIRRPLMVVNGVPLVGFDVAVLESLLGPLPPVTSPMEGCRHPKDGPADRCNKRD